MDFYMVAMIGPAESREKIVSVEDHRFGAQGITVALQSILKTNSIMLLFSDRPKV